MNDKQSLIDRILSDAEKYSEKTVADAEFNALTIKNQTDEWISNYKKSEVDHANQESELYLQRKDTIARLDAKKIELSIKQKLVKSVFDDALEKLLKLNKQEYLALVEREINAYAQNGDCVVIAKGANINSDDIKGLKIYGEKNLTCREGGNFAGGVMLEGKKTDTDLSFSALVNSYAENHYSEIATRLFENYEENR